MSKPKPGCVYLVGAGPGDPGLLTVRGSQILGRAEVVVHDALVDARLLRLVPAGAEIVDAGKRKREHTLSQDEINDLLRERARAGKTVVRLKGGDPYVFGRGGEEAEILAQSGIPFEVVPGVSSFSAVASTAGIPLTHRKYASAFTVLTGHEDPTRPAVVDWGRMAGVHGTKVILMGLGQLEDTSRALIEGGTPARTPIALIRWGTTPAQQTVVGTLGDIVEKARSAALTPPVVAVIGEVVLLRERLNWFEKRPLFGKRIVVTRSREQAGELGHRFEELGADVLEIPTIRIVPPVEKLALVECLSGLGEYDWIVFTSAQGVTAFFEALLAAFEDIRAVGNVRLAAIGPATAARLKDFHLRVDAVPDEFVGRAIAKAIGARESLENLRILLARAQSGNPEVCLELEEAGAIVDDVAFYQTVPETDVSDGTAEKLAENGADWITFTSGSTVEHFHARFDLLALAAKHPRLRLATIGPETSKSLRRLGLDPSVEAKPHTTEGLVRAVASARG